ncbi:hypothetical protein OJ996_12505 [Luteolibacter sp. GHJ8]|jgi:hypothetical protein|uniref:Uncharacterized protein n=1 Tax=Luteolibacter rhizosphaerae TaxID=2989719 RepID=A0ABT3G4F7_9BACT|nr:hypothetical protein [Luteolibacter rhizosphaerae]MCW1914401.1 hypothetical protein [Luteolibacter rhizosphaerae]
MKKPAFLLLYALCVLLQPLPLQAQQNNEDDGDGTEQVDEDNAGEDSSAEESQGPKRFWSASLQGGDYSVALDKVSSVSIHEYVLNANLIVTEMVIDTDGRALARFYHVRSVAEDTASGAGGRLVERGKDLIDGAGRRAKVDFHNLPQKDYPTTSHAGMIEFRLMRLNDLKALHKSIQGAWESNTGKKVTIK